MPTFVSYDGTELDYHVLGTGRPLLCVPGGPGRAAAYLGNLGGLDTSRQLVLLDPRGVGDSPDPADPTTFRVDRLVADLDALRAHLGLDRMDLLAHSAGAILGTLYAAAHPDRVANLALITPNLAAIDVHGTDDELAAALRNRAGEPWYASARAALDKILGGDLTLATFHESRPLFYGRWDDAARAHAGVGIAERHVAAREGYFAGVTLDAPATKAALTELTAPVLLYAGELDAMVTPATLRTAIPRFPDATVVVGAGAGHFPWVDDPTGFAAAVNAFLG
ncbi:alpha/beta fold hydrolase [Actinocrispum wychmicini]|uniref:Pimeloyl-ACP methyl ester carboxylesterase n=1 Tax=Actinocrispum wychmicini TaxID=1213861 RepID=A0A4R2JLG2_9PSEU|nr:alpha/beta hydrolase [Actinocrispum wychmicini]TCO55025.1 pimeloyl-ACP methyl ester carboxylesterase [Actinocrispum wychmicini]